MAIRRRHHYKVFSIAIIGLLDYDEEQRRQPSPDSHWTRRILGTEVKTALANVCEPPLRTDSADTETFQMLHAINEHYNGVPATSGFVGVVLIVAAVLIAVFTALSFWEPSPDGKWKKAIVGTMAGTALIMAFTWLSCTHRGRNAFRRPSVSV